MYNWICDHVITKQCLLVRHEREQMSNASTYSMTFMENILKYYKLRTWSWDVTDQYFYLNLPKKEHFFHTIKKTLALSCVDNCNNTYSWWRLFVHKDSGTKRLYTLLYIEWIHTWWLHFTTQSRLPLRYKKILNTNL